MRHAWLLIAALGALACNKVPLEAAGGSIDFGAAHWFETEKTAYIFFSLSEETSRLIDPEWHLHWTEATPSGGTLDHPDAAIDFTKGVHAHRLLPCGDNRLCGSYSFHADNPLTAATLTFFYDKSSPLSLTADLPFTNHTAANTQDAYSALGYGVFSEKNDRLEVRIHHNFGSPSDELVDSFGMTRRFHATARLLTDISASDAAAAQTSTGTPLIFPAPFCGASGGAGDLQFAGTSGWFSDTVDPTDGKDGACFDLDFLDQHGASLFASGPVAAFGRRNPELADGPPLTLLTPLKAAIQLPVVIRICPDDPAAGAMVDTDFFNYQEMVLGMQGRPVDLCFHISQETQFESALQTLLAQRLAAARASATNGQDFIFVVILHDKFTSEFQTVQQAIADQLYAIVNAETSAVSPRLAGAFVYASSTVFAPSAQQAQLVLWCPQELNAKILTPASALAAQNCTTTPTGKLDLQVINFVTPLGPLPSLSDYDAYVKAYGDAGTARSPQLTLNTVPTGPNTVEEGSKAVTYFDAERYAIGPGEAAKVCGDRVDPNITSFEIKPAGQTDSVPGIAYKDINALWLSANGPGEYRIGIGWEYQFWGGISYKGALNGKVVSVIPYTKSFDSYESLGDPKWEAQSWDFGHYVQHCYRYCDNPFFDASGTYQAATGWRTYQEDACPAPVYPQPP